jgi:excisionase family DNA binding protein
MASAVHTMLREVMDIRQASDYLGISGDTLYRYASEGLIPAFKLGNRWRFKRSLLDAWMVEQSSGGGDAKHCGGGETAEAGSAGAVKSPWFGGVFFSWWRGFAKIYKRFGLKELQRILHVASPETAWW